MNRIVGIVISVIGLILVVLGTLKIVYGVSGTGFSLILLGGLVIGLSFISAPPVEDTPRMSTFESLTAIFYAPTDVFKNLRNHPRWLMALILMTMLTGIYSNLFMYHLTPEKIVNFSTDKTLESSFVAGNEEAKKQIEAGRTQAIADAKNPVLRVTQLVNGFVGAVFLYAFLGLVYFLFVLVMGGEINFWQAFSTAIYAAFPIALIRNVLSSIILFIKDPIEIHPILGQSSLVQDNLSFLVTPAETPVLYVLLSGMGLLTFYWLWLNATGLKNAGANVSSGSAWSSTLAIFLLSMTLGVSMAFLFPGFFG